MGVDSNTKERTYSENRTCIILGRVVNVELGYLNSRLVWAPLLCCSLLLTNIISLSPDLSRFLRPY